MENASTNTMCTVLRDLNDDEVQQLFKQKGIYSRLFGNKQSTAKMARWLKIQKPKVCYTIITAMFGASDDTQAASDDETQAASDDDTQAALDGNTQATSDVFMQGHNISPQPSLLTLQLK